MASSLLRGGPTSHIYFSQRLRLHYVDWGNDDAPPMLLVHGGRDHCRNWDWVAQAFKADYHVIAPDLRGHGDSQWLIGGGYATIDYVYDIAQLVRQTGIDDMVLVGHSMGGSVSLAYAGLCPEKVGKLITIEGMGMSLASADDSIPATNGCLRWVEDLRQLSGPHSKRYPTMEGRFPAHAAGQSSSHRGAGAPSHHPRQQPERRRHLQLEVRQLHARLVAGGAVGATDLRPVPAHRLPGRC